MVHRILVLRTNVVLVTVFRAATKEQEVEACTYIQALYPRGNEAGSMLEEEKSGSIKKPKMNICVY